MLVLDAEHDLLVFDRSGGFTQRLGRRGDGPGEFRAIASIAPRREGGVITFDARHFRIDTFDDTLASVSSRTVVPSIELSAMKVNGTALAMLHIGDADSIGAPADAFVLWVDAATGDTAPPIRFRARSERPRGSDLQPIPKPFEARLLWDVSDAKDVVVGFSDTDTLHVLDSTGTLVSTLSRPWTPARISRREMDSVRDALLNPGGRPSASPSYRAQVEQLLDGLPREHPRLADVRFSSTRDIWVRRAGRFADSVRWDRFAYTGAYEGTLHLSVRDRLLRVRGDTVFLLVTDTSGVPYLGAFIVGSAVH